MNKKEFIELQKKFKTGPAHIFNPVPMNKEEALAHGNALAASGNYPVGTSNCFNVGISGGCGSECFVYLNGECGEPQEIISRLDAEGLKQHQKLYTCEETNCEYFGRCENDSQKSDYCPLHNPMTKK